MKHAFSAFVATGLLASSMPAAATPLTDLFDYSLATDLATDFWAGGPDLFLYNASTDRLTFTVQQTMPGEWYVCSRGECEDTQSGLLYWTGGVDKHGRVTDSGSMSWFADFGSGMELMATGRVLQVGTFGFAEMDFERVNVGTCGGLQLLFDFDFRSSRISAETDRALLSFFYTMYSPEPDLFASDFACGTNVSIGLVIPCDAFSNTGLLGYRAVPEPSALALLGLGLAALGMRRRGKTSGESARPHCRYRSRAFKTHTDVGFSLS